MCTLKTHENCHKPTTTQLGKFTVRHECSCEIPQRLCTALNFWTVFWAPIMSWDSLKANCCSRLQTLSSCLSSFCLAVLCCQHWFFPKNYYGGFQKKKTKSQYDSQWDPRGVSSITWGKLSPRNSSVLARVAKDFPNPHSALFSSIFQPHSSFSLIQSFEKMCITLIFASEDFRDNWPFRNKKVQCCLLDGQTQRIKPASTNVDFWISLKDWGREAKKGNFVLSSFLETVSGLVLAWQPLRGSLGLTFPGSTHMAEDHGLGNGDGPVDVTESPELLISVTAQNVILLDGVQGLLLTLQFDNVWIRNNFLSKFPHRILESGWKQEHLAVPGEHSVRERETGRIPT